MGKALVIWKATLDGGTRSGWVQITGEIDGDLESILEWWAQFHNKCVAFNMYQS